MAEDGWFRSIGTSCYTEVGPGCLISATIYGDYFSTPTCALFVGIYGAYPLDQLGFEWQLETCSYTAYLIVGSVCEFISYISRVRLPLDPHSHSRPDADRRCHLAHVQASRHILLRLILPDPAQALPQGVRWL